MARNRITVILTLLITLTAAHDDEHMDIGNTTKGYDAGVDLPNYAGLGAHDSLIWAHIFFMTLAWFFILPIGVVLSIARSKFVLFVQFVFLVVNGIGLVVGTIYNISTPDLYTKNAHHPIGWIATWIMTAQVVMNILFVYAGRSKKENISAEERAAFIPTTLRDLNNPQNRAYVEYRWSRDSGHGSEVESPRSDSRDLSPSLAAREYLIKSEQEEQEHFVELPILTTARRPRLIHNKALHKYMSPRITQNISGKVLKILEVVYEVIDRLILFLSFIALTTGGVTFVGIFRGQGLFSGLAHFVKGGIFFWWGLLSLGRWLGCWSEIGWAWNVKPTCSEVGAWRAAIPTAEFTESFVIFLYGVTNVFLEHLANWGGEWSAEDFEHVSITVMFFGGGLFGMFVESKTIRKWLSTSVDMMPLRVEALSHEAEELRAPPKQYSHSMNPVPALIILLLGIMMSSHHQESAVSTMVHKQWGTLLCGFSLARGFTYVLQYLSPPTSLYPSRPPTELIASFCLISGGLVFMSSARNCIQLMEKHNLMAMFIFTVTMGFTAFIMAYETFVLSLRGWAIRRKAAQLYH